MDVRQAWKTSHGGREDLIERGVDKALRERHMWVAAATERATEPEETEEVKRTGPVCPAPCSHGRRKGEGDSQVQEQSAISILQCVIRILIERGCSSLAR